MGRAREVSPFHGEDLGVFLKFLASAADAPPTTFRRCPKSGVSQCVSASYSSAEAWQWAVRAASSAKAPPAPSASAPVSAPLRQPQPATDAEIDPRTYAPAAAYAAGGGKFDFAMENNRLATIADGHEHAHPAACLLFRGEGAVR